MINTNSNRITIDPNESFDFKIKWDNNLASGETIASHVVSLDVDDSTDSDLEIYNDVGLTTSVIFWIRNGTERSRYKVTCRITTTSNRVFEDSIYVTVRDK